jgi:tRNA A-37 threonylcarbamoyl transferase component Bud32/type IV secretory pathway VirB2 component (pilin)
VSRTRRPSDGPTARLDDEDGRAAGEGPRILERYALRKRLGTGAFGTVWLARDERLQRDVAVKILARELVSGGRFEREARAAARLSHPGIVTLYEAAVDDEGAYLVSELVRGETLDALLAEGRLSDRDILQVGVGLCDALAHAHEQGVVHRDIKPSNVLVPRSGRSTRSPCKLTDFGVARVIDSESLTLTGDVIGTLNYMSPEQAAGLEAGEGSDLYALALVLYEALSGVNPLRSSGAVSRRSRSALTLPPLRRQRRDLPATMSAAIDRALRPRIDERGALSDLRAGLAGAAEQVGQAPGVVTGAFDRGPRDADEEAVAATRLFSARPPEDRAAPLTDGDPSRLIWQARALAAVGSAAVVAWLEHLLLAPHGTLTAPVALAAVIAAGLTLLLPRIGWIALVTYVCLAAILQNHPGAASLVAVGALVPMILMPASPTLWSVSAAAPALGLLGLAGGWPALAGWAHRPWRRMMLGAGGWAWLALAAPLAGRTLYEPRPGPSVDRGAWTGSVIHAAHHVLIPLARDGRLAPAVVWAAAAVILPWVVPRRRPLLAVAGAVVWAAALTYAVPSLIDVITRAHSAPAAASALTGGVAAAGFALAPVAVDATRRALARANLPGGVS